MAATIHQLPTCRVSNEDLKEREICNSKELWENRNCKPSPAYSDSKHQVIMEPLTMDSWRDPPWAHEVLRNREFIGDPCHDILASAQIDSFVASLRVCTRNKDLVRGTSIHHDLVQRGLLERCSDALVTMYAKCGELAKAKMLLDKQKSKDVITWTSLIAGYAREGLGQHALDCFEQMQYEGVLPNAVTFACTLKACASIRAADRGKQIHDEIARQGLLQNSIVVGGALVDMYAKCGALSEAQRVLEELPSRNVVSWSALIAGYAQEGRAEQALNCLEQMQHEGILPNAVTYVSALKACSIIRVAARGKQIHDKIVRQQLLHNNIVLGNALVDMYAKCGDVSEARRVLEELPSRDIVSWGALVGGYLQEGQAEEALNCVEQMQREGTLPDMSIYLCALKACAMLRGADRGKKIHDKIARQGLLQNNAMLGGALVDMYAKCGAVSKARRVHEELSSRNVFSWNALIAGYAQEGEAEQALDCLEQMQHEGILPDAVTYVSALKACATIRAADSGKKIHEEVMRQQLLENSVVLGNALVDMYAKCGVVSEAQRVLEELLSRDIISWNALIGGYAQEGQSEQALNCFQQMQCEGILPDEITWTCVLNVCSHRGLVEEGEALFVNMSTNYGVKPSLECYTCMIDLFGRAGHLEKAVRLIQEVPSSHDIAIWRALLGACRKWEDVNVGEWAFEQAVKLDKSQGSTYVLMAHI